MAKMTKAEESVFEELEFAVEGTEQDFKMIACGRYLPRDVRRAYSQSTALLWRILGAKKALTTIAPENRQEAINKKADELLDRLFECGAEL